MGQAGYDYAVVGGGAAGCVMAARLVAAGAGRVLLVEAGGPDNHPLIGIPGANVVTGSLPSLNWNYRTQPVPALNGRELYWAQGRVLGGSGAINGMMYVRGQPGDFDHWRDGGATGWGYDDVLPAFRRSETNERGASDLHGGSGPVRVSRGQSTAPVCDLFLAASAEMGHHQSDDLNAPAPEGFGHVDMNVHRGRRSSTASAYLHPVAASPNLTVRTRTMVTRLLLRNGRAEGIVCVTDGRAEEIRVTREVILCGGSVNSPEILLTSGIGPAGELRALGIDVVADLPGVGQNLQNHPFFKLMFRSSAPVTGYSHVRPLGAMRAGLNFVFAKGGPLARGLFPTAGMFRVEEGDHGMIQVCLAPALVIRRKPGIFGILPQEHGFTLLVNQGIPRSTGRIHLVRERGTLRAVIEPDCFDDPRDVTTLARGITHLRAMMRQSPLAGIVAGELAPDGAAHAGGDLIDDIRANAATHYHPVGTCRMGTDDLAVVGPDLRLRGIEGVRIADASVMPRIVNGNTFAATVMVAERAAEFITGRAPAGPLA